MTMCSAAVIHPLLLITAARCTRYFRAGDFAVTGDHRKSTFDGTEQVRTVKRIIIHENYDPPTFDNDIALLVLEEPLRFDNNTRFIEIPRWNLSRKRKFLY